ncbi:sortase domain-bontaining protein [Nocardioides sp. LS1]|uniref:sortase domain-containing protein n=1 Tax=Nocardioides sp. LS1 TaxID=1027620 RepID=UPI000F61FB7C|nr:sortase [Nocardioides sp. LS1]GCD89219.1 class F sortase [Nocardioides sp. LS1]
MGKALGLLLAGTAVVLAVLALRTAPLGHDTVRTHDPVSATPRMRGSTAPERPARPAALPVHLSIPSIAVSTDVERLGLQPDHTVEVPRDPARAGWFEEGPPPGGLGASVVLGHVDSVEGPAVFSRLAQLRPGERITVRLSDESTVRFAVRRVVTYANDDFPARLVYAGDARRRQLNLVTCGGWYDADLGGWQGNVVVFSERVP